MANELSVELSYEDIRTAIVEFGFHIEVSQTLISIYVSLQTSCSSSKTIFIFLLQVEKESVQTTYTENDRSMLRYVYDCVFFVARKPTDMYSNDQEDDQPAAKALRREDSGSLTWQEILLKVKLTDEVKIRLTKRKRKCTPKEKKKKSVDIFSFLSNIFSVMHLMEKWVQTRRPCFVFLWWAKHPNSSSSRILYYAMSDTWKTSTYSPSLDPRVWRVSYLVLLLLLVCVSSTSREEISFNCGLTNSHLHRL